MRNHSPKPLLLGRITSEKLLSFEQARTVGDGAEVMRKARAKVSPRLMHILARKKLEERPERKLINLASPIFDPAEVCFSRTRVRNRDLRNQHGIVTERRKNNLINRICMARNFFAEIPNPKHAVKAVGVPGIKRPHGCCPIGKLSEPAGETSSLRRIIVQKLRSAFILPYPNMPVVRGNCHNAIVAHLMNVLGCSQYSRVHLGHSFRIFDLIAGVMKSRQPELILNPFAEVARTVSLLMIRNSSRAGRTLRRKSPGTRHDFGSRQSQSRILQKTTPVNGHAVFSSMRSTKPFCQKQFRRSLHASAQEFHWHRQSLLVPALASQSLETLHGREQRKRGSPARSGFRRCDCGSRSSTRACSVAARDLRLHGHRNRAGSSNQVANSRRAPGAVQAHHDYPACGHTPGRLRWNQ